MAILLRYEIQQIPLWNSCYNWSKKALNTSHLGFLLSPWNVSKVIQGDFFTKKLSLSHDLGQPDVFFAA
jgi:hypothetical protein